MSTILGIDEAGRGSVIGPLVVAGVQLKPEKLAQLEALGVNDSKQLTRDEREVLAPQIEAVAEQTYLVVLITENKADSQFLIVGAASILAKVKRDALVRELHKEYGDFGWGYPGEPKTREFLQDWHERHGRLPSCVRMKWKTVQLIMQMQTTFGF